MVFRPDDRVFTAILSCSMITGRPMPLPSEERICDMPFFYELTGLASLALTALLAAAAGTVVLLLPRRGRAASAGPACTPSPRLRCR
jgi:hypothetical protein